MIQTTIDVVDTFVGLIGGLAISVISFYIIRKITRRAERVEMLREHVRKFFPTLKELGDDLSYSIALRIRSDEGSKESEELIKKLFKKLKLFEKKYSKFRIEGLEPELDSSDSKLLNELKGLFIMWKMDNRSVFSNKIDVYEQKVIVCLNLVENYLKK